MFTFTNHSSFKSLRTNSELLTAVLPHLALVTGICFEM